MSVAVVGAGWLLCNGGFVIASRFKVEPAVFRKLPTDSQPGHNTASSSSSSRAASSYSHSYCLLLPLRSFWFSYSSESTSWCCLVPSLFWLCETEHSLCPSSSVVDWESWAVLRSRCLSLSCRWRSGFAFFSFSMVGFYFYVKVTESSRFSENGVAFRALTEHRGKRSFNKIEYLKNVDMKIRNCQRSKNRNASTRKANNGSNAAATAENSTSTKYPSIQYSNDKNSNWKSSTTFCNLHMNKYFVNASFRKHVCEQVNLEI